MYDANRCDEPLRLAQSSDVGDPTSPDDLLRFAAEIEDAEAAGDGETNTSALDELMKE